MEIEWDICGHAGLFMAYISIFLDIISETCPHKKNKSEHPQKKIIGS